MKLPVTQDYIVQEWMIVNSEMTRTQKLQNNFRHYLFGNTEQNHDNFNQDIVLAN